MSEMNRYLVRTGYTFTRNKHRLIKKLTGLFEYRWDLIGRSSSNIVRYFHLFEWKAQPFLHIIMCT